ncbi:TonB-dependent receptor domain-containing protein [Hyalangium rubrum]|uniref:TonB-dependent receptor n=1 Tax=Hyalangium rubrum TaxID=3103134 RepID=A0ABU5GYH9_9BACT|nr:TonB-dependent receptor [Hyalangium sp. s54d21]MDY7226253.1 TonB-dependent receptor [Hyalangium sp. s54d21]
MPRNASRHLLLLGVLLTGSASAYEGATPPSEQQAAEAETPPPAPQLTKAPEVLKFVEATYPPEALARGETAQVVFFIDIDETGKVTQAEVTRSAGAEFDAAAREAVLQLEFSPAEVDGKPAPVRIEYAYHFEPKPPPPTAPTAEVEKPINFRGRVVQRGTRDPVANATVYLPEQNLSAETDADGNFELRGVTPGRLRVEISEPKHKKFFTVEEVREGEVTELTAYIWKKVENGFETVVVGAREKKEVARRTLAKQEVQSVPGTFGDPVRVLQNMPGMARAPYISGALLVRGAQPEDSQVMIDGVPIPLLYHFAGGPSVITPSIIDRIDFFPGAYGAKYGRAIAGIVDVGTRPPEPKRLHGLVDIDLLDAGFYVESPLSQTKNRGTLALAARRSYIDVLLPPVLEAFREPGSASTAVAPYYWDYQARYDLKLGKDRFEVVAFGSSDTLVVSQTGSEETQPFSLDTHQSFHRLRLAWSRPTESGWRLSLAPTVGLTVNNIGIGDQFEGGLNSRDLNLRGAAEKEFSKSLSFEAGVDVNATFYTLKLEVPGVAGPGEEDPPPVTREQDVPMASYATYAEAVWSPIERLKFVPGLRFEAYRLPSGWHPSLEPRLATRFEVNELITAKAAWGLYRQAPQPGQVDTVFGNPDLGLSRSHQTVAGFEWKLTDAVLLDMQGFYNWRQRLVVSSDQFVERDGERVPELYTHAGRGRAYGMEVLLKHELTERFYGWVAYTLSRSEQFDEEAKLYAPVQFDQSHILTLVGSYKLDNGWELGARFRLTTGRPETPIIGSTFDADRGRYVPLEGVPGSARGSTFHQLDLRAERQWTFERWRLSAYLDIQNIYNAANPEGVLWDYRYRENAPLRGLPLLPTFGVKGEF